MWGQTSPPISLTSAALAALVHAAMVAILLLFPASNGHGEGLSETIIPVTLVAPVAPEKPAPEPASEPAPEPRPAPKVEPASKPGPTPEPPASPAPTKQTAPEAETPAEPMAIVPDSAQPDLPPPSLSEPSAPEDGIALTSPPNTRPTDTAQSKDAADTPDLDDATRASKAQASPPGDGRKRSRGDSKAVMTAYLNDVRQHLLQHAPGSVPGARDCEVEFRLSPEGQVTARAIRTSSGTPRYDRRCLKSIEAAAPFPAAPPDAAPDDLHFTILIRQPR